MAVSGASFTHPITRLEVNASTPDSLNAGDLNKVYGRVARKAGYEKLSETGSAFIRQSKLSKFNYFSAGGRNAQTTARAYYESGHLLTAAILRETHTVKEALKQSAPQLSNVDHATENLVWAGFKNNSAIQRNFKRQDYINHRKHMLEGGEKSDGTHSENNRFSRIATRIAQGAMSVWECTCAPTGFGSKMVRNTMFHGVSEGGMINKTATIGLSLGIGLGVTSLTWAIRNASGSNGYGFNPVQMITGVLVAFAAVSSLAGLVSWVAGLTSQAKLKNLDPSEKQKQFIQFEMDCTLNKINTLLIDSQSNAGKMALLSKAFTKKFPVKAGHSHTTTTLLTAWASALNGKTSTEDRLHATKAFLGEYLQSNSTSGLLQKEKEFATLAGFVEHFTIEEGNSVGSSHRTHRMDGRQFAEKFAQQISRTLLKGLVYPAKAIDKVFRTNNALSGKVKRLASSDYAKLKASRLKDPSRAHLNKYDTEYISSHLHQYGPITRALMQTSNFIHNFNYNYILAVNTQTSRLFSNLAILGQEKVLGQHNSKIMCNALGRFIGSATVTLVSFFGISALAGLTGGGQPADGFQNSSQVGSAKLSWLVTGTLMGLIGIPAFALGLMAKGTAALEGWKGDIERPLPSTVRLGKSELITI